MKKIKAIIFLSVLYIPFVLGVVANVTGLPVDVTLKGYTNIIEKPIFSGEAFFSGEYQAKYTSWFDSDMAAKGILTKTYSTLRYKLFNLGNRPIGANGDVYEENYINTELGLGENYDFSLEKNEAAMEEFVDHLVSVQEKLQKYNKSLYVYVTANKADFNYENIPKKYKNMANETYKRPVDSFRENIEKTNVPYMICSDLREELEYPAFYTTGIHWSRTFEQQVSTRVISDISKVSGKNYRNLVLGEVQSGSTPFWRDSDVFDLLNVWDNPACTYYEYEVDIEYPKQYEKIRWLIQGDSFAQGLQKDILDNYPYEEIYYVNYDNYVEDSNWVITELNKSWDNFDFNYYLNNTDVVVIQMAEVLVNDYASGFVEALDAFLDSYEADMNVLKEKNFIECLDAESGAEWPEKQIKGFHALEGNFAWTKPYSKVVLKDAEVVEKGLEIIFAVPEQVFGDGIVDKVMIYINGTLVYENEFEEAWSGSVLLEGDCLQELKNENDIYSIEIYSSKSFVPSEIEDCKDDRELALRISYVGRMR